MHIQLLTSALELILNQALSMGNAQASILTKLEQKSLAVSLAELNAVICLTVSQQKLLVTSPSLESNTADCLITTSINTLVKLNNEQQLTQLIKSEQLDLSGDIKVAQLYAALFESLNIDWQSELEKHIGDIATYKLVQLAITTGSKLKFAQRQISSDATEWLVHEKKWVVTAYDIAQYQEQVAHIATQIEQTEKHIDVLTNKLNQLTLSLT